jgi:transketolase
VVIRLIPEAEFRRVAAFVADRRQRLALIADMCRANTLAAVKRAGSGHLGSSFSAMDIVVWLYYERMNTVRLGVSHSDRDVYFSSKGHDVPGLYSVLHSVGLLSGEKLMRLRRYGGLDGHPDIGVPGIEANSGSLGMGISKGRGIAWAKHRTGRGGHVYVMTGDGELQEGQNYEALLNGVNHRAAGLTVVVDHNKVQSDRLVSDIGNLGEIEAKFRTFGWHVARCDGHDFTAFDEVFATFDRVSDKPRALILDTIKGRGVSFMEHPAALSANCGLYPWHAGAPDDDSFLAAHGELVDRINERFQHHGLDRVAIEEVPPESAARVARQNSSPNSSANSLDAEPASIAAPVASSATAEFVSKAYGRALVELAATRPDLIVLDADLAADCKIRDFEVSYPDRFIENGIAEQDMVSMAGGLARHGLLPVVNSFASFLAARANEQIYNNASEHTKIIYVCHYAGLIPAGPGKSHQSIRDVSLLAALPNMIIVQPCNAEETRQIVEFCVQDAAESCAIRLAIGPSPRVIPLPAGYRLRVGRGVAITEGTDGVLFAYGPVMLHEALVAAGHLKERGFDLRVINLPWLNRVDAEWLVDAVSAYPAIYVLDDHSPVGGLGDCILNTLMNARALQGRPVVKFAVEGYPACGTPTEALEFHGLDGASLTLRILRAQDGG